MLVPETYTGGMVSTNGFLFRLPGFTVLVDAPHGINAWLQSAGVKVDALFLTHQHFDHVQDAAVVKESHGCPIYAWSAFDRNLTLETFFGAVTGTSLHVPEYSVDVLLEGKDSLAAGDLTWELFHVPGHSLDSVCFFQKDHQLLFGGDVLFCGGMGRTDFPGGSTEQLISGIQQKLWPLPETTRVFPGHGSPTTLGRERRENPYLK